MFNLSTPMTATCVAQHHANVDYIIQHIGTTSSIRISTDIAAKLHAWIHQHITLDRTNRQRVNLPKNNPAFHQEIRAILSSNDNLLALWDYSQHHDIEFYVLRHHTDSSELYIHAETPNHRVYHFIYDHLDQLFSLLGLPIPANEHPTPTIDAVATAIAQLSPEALVRLSPYIDMLHTLIAQAKRDGATTLSITVPKDGY